MSIPLRTLGRTSLVVSRLGLGLAALGRPAYMVLGHDSDIGDDKSPAALEARCRAVLDRAYELGVRYVDAARSYGLAEDFLARWIGSRSPVRTPVVGSKWGYTYTAEFRMDAPVHEVKEHSLSRFAEQLAESRALLGAHLALYQIHSATLDSGVLSDAGVLDALARLRDEGVLVGLSTTGPDQPSTIRTALAIERGGEPLFGVIQSTWNVLEPSAGEALAEAHEAGVGVIVKEGVANGRLAGRAEDLAARVVVEEARRLDTTPDALALAAILALPFADVVLSGAATIGQLESNVRAFDVVLDDHARDRLASIAEEPRTYWAARKTLPWT